MIKNLFLVLALLALTGCERKLESDVPVERYATIKIGQCEYFVVNTYGGAEVPVHRGDCHNPIHNR